MNWKNDITLIRVVFEDDGSGDPYKYAALFVAYAGYETQIRKAVEEAHAEWYSLTDEEKQDLELRGIEHIYSFIDHKLEMFNEEYPKANCSWIDYEDIVL